MLHVLNSFIRNFPVQPDFIHLHKDCCFYLFLQVALIQISFRIGQIRTLCLFNQESREKTLPTKVFLTFDIFGGSFKRFSTILLFKTPDDRMSHSKDSGR